MLLAICRMIRTQNAYSQSFLTEARFTGLPHGIVPDRTEIAI